MTYPADPRTSAAPPAGYGVPPPALAPDGRALAGFGDRFLARIVDTLIAMAVGLVSAIPLLVGMYLAIVNESTTGLVLVALAYPLLFVVSIAFSYVYEVELQLKGGQTYGKRFLKIQVVPIAPGQPLTRMLLVRRWLVWSVANSFVPFLVLIDGLWQLWDKPYQQCLHDKAAETIVVKVAS